MIDIECVEYLFTDVRRELVIALVLQHLHHFIFLQSAVAILVPLYKACNQLRVIFGLLTACIRRTVFVHRSIGR